MHTRMHVHLRVHTAISTDLRHLHGSPRHAHHAAFQSFFDEGLTAEATAAKLRPAIAAGLRPAVPKRWPASLASLLERCWAEGAQSRPDFAEICAELEAMRDDAKAAMAASRGVSNESDDGRRGGGPAGAADAQATRGLELLRALDGKRALPACKCSVS